MDDRQKCNLGAVPTGKNPQKTCSAIDMKIDDCIKGAEEIACRLEAVVLRILPRGLENSKTVLEQPTAIPTCFSEGVLENMERLFCTLRKIRHQVDRLDSEF
jgi:hypothetical protein